MSQAAYLNLNAATGEPVNLSSVLKDGSMPRLTAVAETYFRKARKLAPAADLEEAGFDFPGGRFELNDNFGLTDAELLFYFNDYEIGPHSLGPTEVSIPLAEIRDLLAPGFTPDK